ncbi:hypothetical protein Q7P35_004590 [Cladosporium inversicolor]
MSKDVNHETRDRIEARAFKCFTTNINAGGMLCKSTWSLDSNQPGQFITATVDLDNPMLPIATTMPDGGTSGAAKAGAPGSSNSSHTAAKPSSNGKDGTLQKQATRPSSNDREKMSDYVAFVDAQAEECCQRLKDEIERASRRA